MAWTCYSCGTKNPNSADQCQKCGGTVAAPRSFYIIWIFGGAVFFFITYLAGVLAGGVLVESVVAPEGDAVLAEVNAGLGEKVDPFGSLDTVPPDKTAAAKASLIARAKAEMSPALRGVLQWLFPVLLFIISGAIVGFVSDGNTILEAGLGSMVGQAGAFLLLMYVFENDLGWLALGIGIVPGFGLGVLGAWLGEVFQERKERAGGITG